MTSDNKNNNGSYVPRIPLLKKLVPRSKDTYTEAHRQAHRHESENCKISIMFFVYIGLKRAEQNYDSYETNLTLSNS